jgi:hypothetical protein
MVGILQSIIDTLGKNSSSSSSSSSNNNNNSDVLLSKWLVPLLLE